MAKYNPEAKTSFLARLSPHHTLHRDRITGIAWVEDTTTGTGHSCHGNISASGSVEGMRRRGYWDWQDRTVKSHGFIYNIDTLITSGQYDEIARQNCRCQGRHTVQP